MKIEKNVDLKKYNTYKIGGFTKYMAFPENIDELKEFISNLKTPYYILGGGSNVILPDQNFDGTIIKLDKLNNYYIDNDSVFVESGMNLNEFINILLNEGYPSLKSLYGIPGTIGGALVGNAGAFGKSIYDDVISVLILKEDRVISIPKENIKIATRWTEFKNSKTIVLGALLKINKGCVAEAREEIKSNLLKRASKQPLKYPNAGSVFKNPDNLYAGALIEECGLKGYNINDAKISDIHANFIVNLKNARSCDIIKLIELIKKEVKDKKNVTLELEQVIVKW